MPLAATGKMDRMQLRARFEAGRIVGRRSRRDRKAGRAACRGREDAEGTTRRGELQSLMGLRHERLDVAGPEKTC